MKEYDADQYKLVLAGIPIDSGYSDGVFLRITHTDKFTMVKGTDGTVTRSKTMDKTARAELVLMQTAQGNAAMSTLHALDVAAPNGAGVGSFLIKDLQGATVYAASKSWIVKPADVELDRSATSRTWLIDIADIVSFEGGNPDV